MEKELVSETFVYWNLLARLSAGEDFIELVVVKAWRHTNMQLEALDKTVSSLFQERGRITYLLLRKMRNIICNPLALCSRNFT
jgi:hypothetical protein